MGRKKKQEPKSADALQIELAKRSREEFGYDTVPEVDDFLKIEGVELVGNLPLQWLLCVDVFPVHAISAIVGPTSSYKSALTYYLFGLVMRNPGLAHLIESENKRNGEQLIGLTSPELVRTRFLPAVTSKIEKALRLIRSYATLYKELVPDMNVPCVLAIDSLGAMTSEADIQRIMSPSSKDMKDGNDVGTAGYGFMHRAASLQETLKGMNEEIFAKLPFALIIVNHQKPPRETTQGSFRSVKPTRTTEQGGEHKEFQFAYKLELTASKGKETKTGGVVRTVYMGIQKNALGPTHRTKLEVPYLVLDATEKHPVHCFDWDTALVQLLFGSEAFPKADVKGVLPAVKSNEGWKCDRLGSERFSTRDFGKAIHNDPLLVKELQDMMGIRRKPKVGADNSA